MSTEKEIEEMIEVLQQYFDRAEPDNDQYNISIIKKDIERYGGQLLVVAPHVLIDGLQRGATLQFLSSSDEAELDRQLYRVGINLIWCYVSLVKGFGNNGVLGVLQYLQQHSDDNEDVATIMAYAFAKNAPSTSPMVASATGYGASILSDAFNKAYGTGYKVALAYALFCCGVKEPFQSYALSNLIVTQNEYLSLRRILDSHDKSEQQYLESRVLWSIILDIASNGRGVPEWKAWKRKE